MNPGFSCFAIVFTVNENDFMRWHALKKACNKKRFGTWDRAGLETKRLVTKRLMKT